MLVMKRSRHATKQIIGKLREAETMPAGGRRPSQLQQELGVGDAAFHRPRNQHGR